MVFQNIEKIIIKYLTNEASANDLDILSEWIVIDDNKKLFETYCRIHLEVNSTMSKPDVDRIKDNLLKKIKKDKNPFFKYMTPSLLKYAAVLAVVFGLGYLYQGQRADSLVVKDNLQESILIPKEELITITLDNGTVQTINTAENILIKDSNGNVVGSQNKSQLSYTKTNSTEKLAYNILSIPHGKRFDLVLSDGSHVFLNSGTTIKYPIRFIDGKNRDVFITGEAYFDVTKDKNHPFVVHANEMNIKVLGTKFNVSNYPESNRTNTVLVEGSVELSNDIKENKVRGSSTLLKPGFKAQWDKSDGTMKVENVDTRIYTAWIDGKLIFRNSSFKKIRKTLERHYNVVIKNSNKDLDAQLFDATFDIETINEILETFSRSYAIEYSIIDNEVIIN